MSDLRASELVEGQAGKPCRPGDGFTVGYWCHEHQRICGVPPSSPSPKPEMLEKARKAIAHIKSPMRREELEAAVALALEESIRETDDAWIERANRYFDGIREPRKLLAESYAKTAILADVVMHEVWKRDPAVSELEAKLRASEAAVAEAQGQIVAEAQAHEICDRVKNERIQVAEAEAIEQTSKAESLEQEHNLERLRGVVARAEVESLRKKLDEARVASREYLKLTDPLITCAAWTHGGENDKPCGDCRCCWMDKAESARAKATKAVAGVQASLESVGRRWKAAEAVIAAMTKKKGTAMPMISFDRLAKSNGVGWTQESIVVALCAEIGHLRLRILDLEAVSHAPVALSAPSSPPPPTSPPTEEPLTCPADGFPLNDHCLYERGFYGTPEPCVNNRMEHHSASYSCRAATPEEIKAAHKCDLIGGDGGLGNCDHFGTLPSPSPEHGGGKA